MPSFRSPQTPIGEDDPSLYFQPQRDPDELLKMGMQSQKAVSSRNKIADDEEMQTEIDRMLDALREVPLPDDALPAVQSYAPVSDAGGYFAKTRGAESGGNDAAVNGVSGATGRYQFMPSTWGTLAKEAPHLGLTPEGIKDPAQQERAMQYYTGKSANVLKQVLGRAPTGGELYALHMFGQNGGASLVANQDAPLQALFPKIVFDQNPFLKNYTTGRQLLADFNRRFA